MIEPRNRAHGGQWISSGNRAKADGVYITEPVLLPGTYYKCGLVRGNLQFTRILGLYGKSKMRRFNFCQILSPKIVEYEPQTR